MGFKISHPFLQIIGIGALAGMRTSSAPVIASHILSRHHSQRLKHSPLNFMQSKKVANTLAVLAISELVADKLPSTPNRTEPAGLLFRSLSGALAGAAISKSIGGKMLTGALLGATSALASTYISYTLRKKIGKDTGIIDPVIGAIEDVLVIGAGVGLSKLA